MDTGERDLADRAHAYPAVQREAANWITARLKSASGSARSGIFTPVGEVKHRTAVGRHSGAIAKEHLGNASAYMKIFELNKDQLTDPDKIKGGQVLHLP